MSNPAHDALNRAVNRAIESGAPRFIEIAAIPADALAAIPPHVRQSIANALRAAATRWREWSLSIANAEVAATFAAQAAEAESFADQFGDC